MPSKTNSLSGLKKNSNLLEKAHGKKRQGRPPKPAAEKAGCPITIKFTSDELEVLKEKAGLIPLATFLRSELHNNTDIFK